MPYLDKISSFNKDGNTVLPKFFEPKWQGYNKLRSTEVYMPQLSYTVQTTDSKMRGCCKDNSIIGRTFTLSFLLTLTVLIVCVAVLAVTIVVFGQSWISVVLYKPPSDTTVLPVTETELENYTKSNCVINFLEDVVLLSTSCASIEINALLERNDDGDSEILVDDYTSKIMRGLTDKLRNDPHFYVEEVTIRSPLRLADLATFLNSAVPFLMRLSLEIDPMCIHYEPEGLDPSIEDVQLSNLEHLTIFNATECTLATWIFNWKMPLLKKLSVQRMHFTSSVFYEFTKLTDRLRVNKNSGGQLGEVHINQCTFCRSCDLSAIRNGPSELNFMVRSENDWKDHRGKVEDD